jgi:hypothetical protein
MENQHKKIKGYRDLSQEEIDAMNEIKAMGEQVGALVEKVNEIEGVDLRWSFIAKEDLQKGFMALVRSVAQPGSF